jgi:sugar phosphate isomerase/epimerase
LGGYFGAESVDALEPLCEKLDVYGLSAIPAPSRLADMPEDECAAFGQQARGLGLVVGEAGMWENLMTDDADVQSLRIERVRRLLQRAERMGCHCVVTLVGSKDPSDRALAPHPYMYGEACKSEFREVVLRILDGLELEKTRYVIEPWHNSFFYQPAEIRAFIDRVDHPAFGLHLDQMNMVSQRTFYHTTELIHETLDLLADRVASVHLKDVRCDPSHMFLKWDEVYVGDGVMDYHTYLKRLAELPPDTPCYCEHLPAERDYALNFSRLHYLAKKAGVRFTLRLGGKPMNRDSAQEY